MGSKVLSCEEDNATPFKGSEKTLAIYRQVHAVLQHRNPTSTHKFLRL